MDRTKYFIFAELPIKGYHETFYLRYDGLFVLSIREDDLMTFDTWSLANQYIIDHELDERKCQIDKVANF